MWGSSDFFGGLATQRQPVARVMLWVHGVGLVFVALAAPFLADTAIGRDLVIGGIAGICGLLGMLALYWALAQGPMAVVAPLSALTAALLPVIWGLSADEPLSQTTVLGLGIGLAAVLAIGWQPASAAEQEDGQQRTTVTVPVLAAAVFAGVGFGSLVIFYDATSGLSAPWPVASGRLATTLLLLAFAFGRRSNIAPGIGFGFAALAGIGDTFANVTLLWATGLADGTELSVVAVLAAFYPAATVLLARVVLHEKLGAVRAAGLALGFVSIALLTLG